MGGGKRKGKAERYWGQSGNEWSGLLDLLSVLYENGLGGGRRSFGSFSSKEGEKSFSI